jgi:carbonic anhydrase/acetyltransferase-like protein (isoleucine patch superfamily)
MARVVTVDGHAPRIDPAALLAPSATVAGRVRLGREVNVWYQAVLRSEEDDLTVGARTNLQDGVVVHTDAGHPVVIADDVQVGHGAVLHGCTIETGVLIGMHATVINGSRVRSGCVVAAGALVLPTLDAPEGWMLAGVPARAVRPTTEVERGWLDTGCAAYVDRARRHGFGPS